MKISLMNVSLKAALSLLAAAVPFAAFAQEDVDKAVEKKVAPYGLLGLNVGLFDSQSSSSLNFENTYARFGLKVSEGIAVGQLELESAMAAITDKYREGKPELAKVGAIGVRHANLGLNLESGTKVLLGRIRPGGANGYGVDSSYVPDNYSSMDGVSIFQDLEFGEGIKLNAGLAVTNGLLSLSDTIKGYVNPGSKLEVNSAKNRIFGDTRLKSDPALLFGLTANVKGVDLVAYYGAEENQLVAREVGKAVPGVRGTDEEGKEIDILTTIKESPMKVADATHTEISLGYSGIEGIAFGAWYTNYTQGKEKSVTSDSGGKIKTQETGTLSYDRTLIGAGVNGDSSLFGLTGLLQTGDKLIYGASFTQTQFAAKGPGANVAETDKETNQPKKTPKATFEDSGTNQIALGAGYTVGGLTLELNFATETAGDKYFSNSKGEGSKEDTWNRMYLATYYAF